jgi:hypothetical protein
MRIRLKDSFFGLGTYFDTLEIQPTNERDPWYNPNPVLVLSFVQSVLGYTLDFQDRDTWHFKREKQFI